ILRSGLQSRGEETDARPCVQVCRTRLLRGWRNERSFTEGHGEYRREAGRPDRTPAMGRHHAPLRGLRDHTEVASPPESDLCRVSPEILHRCLADRVERWWGSPWFFSTFHLWAPLCSCLKMPGKSA